MKFKIIILVYIFSLSFQLLPNIPLFQGDSLNKKVQIKNINFKKATDLGRIHKNFSYDLPLVDVGRQKLYKVRLTKGQLANKPLYFLLRNESKKNNVTDIEIYRHVMGTNPNIWYRVGGLHFDRPLHKLQKKVLTIDLDPSGSVHAGKEVILHAGKSEIAFEVRNK